MYIGSSVAEHVARKRALLMVSMLLISRVL